MTTLPGPTAGHPHRLPLRAVTRPRDTTSPPPTLSTWRQRPPPGKCPPGNRPLPGKPTMPPWTRSGLLPWTICSPLKCRSLCSKESGKTVTGHEYPAKRLVQEDRPDLQSAVRTHSVKETKNNQRRRRRVGMDLNRSLCAPHRSQATGREKRSMLCQNEEKRHFE